jgi:hypothetical protein
MEVPGRASPVGRPWYWEGRALTYGTEDPSDLEETIATLVLSG